MAVAGWMACPVWVSRRRISLRFLLRVLAWIWQRAAMAVCGRWWRSCRMTARILLVRVRAGWRPVPGFRPGEPLGKLRLCAPTPGSQRRRGIVRRAGRAPHSPPSGWRYPSRS